jgi:hypothetical protein
MGWPEKARFGCTANYSTACLCTTKEPGAKKQSEVRKKEDNDGYDEAIEGQVSQSGDDIQRSALR